MKRGNLKPGIELDLKGLVALKRLQVVWDASRLENEVAWPPRIEEIDNFRMLVSVARPRDFRLEVELQNHTVGLDDLRNVLAVNGIREVQVVMQVLKINTDATNEIAEI